MATKTSSSFTNLLKVNYQSPFLTDLIYRDNRAIQFIFGNKKFDGGTKIYRPVRVRRASGSTAYGSETGATPTAAEPVETNAYDNIKFMNTAKEVSQHLLNATKTKEYAYLKAVDDMVMDAKSEHADLMEKHLFTTTVGCLCAMSGAGTSATVLNVATDFCFDQLYVGMKVDVLRITQGDVNSIGVSGDTVASYSASAYTVTLTTGVANYASLTTSYGLFASGTRSGTTNYAPPSLNDICGTGDLHNVPVATYPEYIGIVDTLNAALSLKRVQREIDNIEKKSHGEINMIMASDRVLQDYQFDLIDPRTSQPPGDGVGGTGAVYFKGRSKRQIELQTSCYANPINRMWFLDKSAFETFYTAFTEWMSDDNGNMLHKKSGYPTYEVTLGSEYLIMAVARYRLGYIDDITLGS